MFSGFCEVEGCGQKATRLSGKLNGPIIDICDKCWHDQYNNSLISGILVPLKFITYRSNNMSDGKDLNGFTSPKVNDSTVWGNNEQYAADPKAAFPSTDVSNQAQAQGPK